MKINNLPASAADYEYIVVREVDEDLWYWGAYHDSFQAENAAKAVGGFVVTD